MAGAFRWYQAKLASRPILTQSITTAVLFATGDYMAQQIVERVGHKEHSLARTARMALYGGAVFGPGATLWFRFLQNKVKMPTRPNGEILTKVGMDQTIFAPTNLLLFLSTMAAFEGKSPQERVEQKWPDAYKRNCMVWPAVQFVNFKYVPLEWRVMVVNVVALGWNCYLSYLNSSSGDSSYQSEPPE